jgi:hypothetical protein
MTAIVVGRSEPMYSFAIGCEAGKEGVRGDGRAASSQLSGKS